MKRMKFPSIPAKVDKKRLFQVCDFKLYCESMLERDERELKEMLSDVDSNVYAKVMAYSGVDSNKKILQEIDKKEKKEYKSKFGISMDEDEKNAKSGQNEILVRLISWDKRWLFKNWVKKKVLIAESVDDREFLNQIANAIKSRKFKHRVQIKHIELVNYFKRIKATGINFNKEYDLNLVWNWLGDHPDTPQIPLFEDKKYFCKFLKENGLR